MSNQSVNKLLLVAGRTLLAFVFILSALAGAASALASAVDVGATVPGIDSGFNSIVWYADQFTLSNTTTVSSIQAGIDQTICVCGPYTLSIVDALTGGTTEWNSGSLNTTNPVLNPPSLTLAAGTYYLVGETNGEAGGWFQSNGTLTQIGGTVGPSLWLSSDQGATWTHINGDNPLVFDIQGTSGGGVTPEPTSLLLLGTGLVSVAGALRKKLLG